jgi:hypothetical protein
MMTLQELLNERGAERRAVVHFERPEISDEDFAAEVHLEWTATDDDSSEGSLYRIDDDKHEQLYAFVDEVQIIITQAESAEKAAERVLAIIERSTELARARNPKTLVKLHRQGEWKRRFHLLKMFAAIFLLLVGLSFLNEVWHRHSADPLEVVVGAVLASLGSVLLWSEWKKQS